MSQSDGICIAANCGLWEIFTGIGPLKPNIDFFYFFLHNQSFLSGILIESGSNFDFDKKKSNFYLFGKNY